MSRNLVGITMVLLLAACSSKMDGSNEAAPVNLAVADLNVRIGDPVSHRNLTVFPLYLPGTEDLAADYITLDEALEAKQVEVREVGAAGAADGEQTRGETPDGRQQEFSSNEAQVLDEGEVAQVEAAQIELEQVEVEQVEQVLSQTVSSAGTVNAVEIDNRSDRPLYILAGQVILGGKQDRVLTRDTIVPPGDKLTAEVCCVEQGRWSPRASLGGDVNGSMLFAKTAPSLAQGSIKQFAQQEGKAAQQVVWEEVANSAIVLNAQSDTGTYQEVVEKTEEQVDEYFDALVKTFEKDKQVCGYVVCVNGEVSTFDLFTSPGLLKKFRESLLRGYALDALNESRKEDAGTVAMQEVKEFVRELMAGEGSSETLAQDQHRRVEKRENDRMILFSNSALDMAAENALHLNAFKKN